MPPGDLRLVWVQTLAGTDLRGLMVAPEPGETQSGAGTDTARGHNRSQAWTWAGDQAERWWKKKGTDNWGPGCVFVCKRDQESTEPGRKTPMSSFSLELLILGELLWWCYFNSLQCLNPKITLFCTWLPGCHLLLVLLILLAIPQLPLLVPSCLPISYLCSAPGLTQYLFSVSSLSLGDLIQSCGTESQPRGLPDPCLHCRNVHWDTKNHVKFNHAPQEPLTRAFESTVICIFVLEALVL